MWNPGRASGGLDRGLQDGGGWRGFYFSNRKNRFGSAVSGKVTVCSVAVSTMVAVTAVHMVKLSPRLSIQDCSAIGQERRVWAPLSQIPCRASRFGKCRSRRLGSSDASPGGQRHLLRFVNAQFAGGLVAELYGIGDAAKGETG